jgi:hypothetical protein
LIFNRINSDFNKLRLEFGCRFWYRFGEFDHCRTKMAQPAVSRARPADGDVSINTEKETV